MKFAAIADIHGNRPALEAVLADIAALGIGKVVNLGDHVSGPLEAARTADLLIERGFPSVRGDQDRILIELWQAGSSNRSDFRQLERKHFDWMASMPPTLMYREEVFLCHGSPMDDAAFWLDYVTTEGDVRASPIGVIEAGAEGINAGVILCGHTHVPRVVHLRDGRMIVNPGSVGLPVTTGKRLFLTWSRSARHMRATQFWSIHAEAGPQLSATFPTTMRPWLHWPAAKVC